MAIAGLLTTLVGADITGFRRGMSDASGEARRGSRNINREVAKINRSFRMLNRRVNEFARNMTSARTIIGTLAGASGLGLLIRNTANFADELLKQSQSLDVSIGFLQAFRRQIELNGGSIQQADNALTLLTRNLGLLRSGSGSLFTFLNRTDREFLSLLQSTTDTAEALQLVIDRASSLSTVDQAAFLSVAVGTTNFQPVQAIANTGGFSAIQAEETTLREENNLILTESASALARLNDAISITAGNLRAAFTNAIAENIEQLISGIENLESIISNLLSPAIKALATLLNNLEEVAIGLVAGFVATRLSLHSIVEISKIITQRNKDVASFESGLGAFERDTIREFFRNIGKNIIGIVTVFGTAFTLITLIVNVLIPKIGELFQNILNARATRATREERLQRAIQLLDEGVIGGDFVPLTEDEIFLLRNNGRRDTRNQIGRARLINPTTPIDELLDRIQEQLDFEANRQRQITALVFDRRGSSNDQLLKEPVVPSVEESERLIRAQRELVGILDNIDITPTLSSVREFLEQERQSQIAINNAIARRGSEGLSDREPQLPPVESITARFARLSEQIEATGTTMEKLFLDIDTIAMRSITSLGDTIASGLVRGELAFRDFFNNLAVEILQASIRRSVTDPLVQSITAGGGTFFSELFSFNEGGYVRGAGTSTSDSILARLSNGEFVVNARAYARNQRLVNSINNGAIPKFQTGGVVGNAISNNSSFSNSQFNVFNNSTTARVDTQVRNTPTGKQYDAFVNDVGTRIQRRQQLNRDPFGRRNR